MKRLLFKILLFFKGIFAFKLEESTNISPEGISITKRIRRSFFDVYSEEKEDKVDYTNTHEDHHSNFNYLDDYDDERFHRIGEQVGLIYEEDGRTPKNAAAVFDLTYEEYEEYKAKLLPHARNVKLTEEIIEAFLGTGEEPTPDPNELDKLDLIKEDIKNKRRVEAEQKVANAVLKLKDSAG